MNTMEYALLAALAEGGVVKASEGVIQDAGGTKIPFGKTAFEHFVEREWIESRPIATEYKISVQGRDAYRRERFLRDQESLIQRGLNIVLDEERLFLFPSGFLGLREQDVADLIFVLTEMHERMERHANGQ